MSSVQSPGKLSIKQLQIVFGISHMTAFQWRRGTKSVTAIPQAANTKAEAALPRPPVQFAASALRTWAKKNGIEFAVDPDTVLAAGSTVSKPGPKTKTAPAVKAKAAKTVVATAKVVPIRKASVKKEASPEKATA